MKIKRVNKKCATHTDVERSVQKLNKAFGVPHVDINRLVEERQSDYGHPVHNFALIARMWSAYFGQTFTSQDVGVFNILQKLSRQKYKHKPDNLTDIKGYVKCIEQIHEHFKNM